MLHGSTVCGAGLGTCGEKGCEDILLFRDSGGLVASSLQRRGKVRGK